MGRSFSFDYDGRTLSVRPIPVDEGWDLWVMEGENRLVCAGQLTVEEVVLAGREGQDRIQAAADEIRHQVVAGRLALVVPDRSAA
jgi:hypothetical protein